MWKFVFPLPAHKLRSSFYSCQVILNRGRLRTRIITPTDSSQIKTTISTLKAGIMWLMELICLQLEGKFCGLVTKISTVFALQQAACRGGGRSLSKRQSSPYNLPRRHSGGVEVQLYHSFNLGARWGEWLTLHAVRCTPENYPLPSA